MRTREDENISLLNFPNSDDEEITIVESSEESISFEPINTLAILHKLERQEQLQALHERLGQIDKREKIKYTLPAAAAGFGMASIASYAGFLAYYFTQPNWEKVLQTHKANEYTNWSLTLNNPKSCGELFPLSSNVCINPVNESIRWFCQDLSDTAKLLQAQLNFTKHIMQEWPNSPTFSVFDTICGIPNLLAYCKENFGIGNALNNIYSFATQCQHLANAIQSSDYFNLTGCNSSSITSSYSKAISWSLYDGGPVKSCSEVFPVNFCMNTESQFLNISSCLGTAETNCNVISRFSYAVANAMDLTAEVFFTALNATLNQYNQTLINYQHIPVKILQLSQEYEQKNMELNAFIPGLNYSCASKYSESWMVADCALIANQICDRNPVKTMDETESSFNMKHIFLLVGVSATFLLFFGTALASLWKGTTWLEQKTKVDELDEEIEEIKEVFEACDLLDDEDINEMKISVASDRLKNAVVNLPEGKQLINNMRHSFLMGRDDASSPIPANLPNEIAQKIFHHANLFKHSMDNQITEMRFSFLMICKNSGILANLPNEVVYTIFVYAGIASKLPASLTFVPDSIDTNRHLRNNCFTLLLGRDDENSSIPDITPKNVFQKIYSYAGLFRQQLSVGKFEVISNEKLAKVEMQKKQELIDRYRIRKL